MTRSALFETVIAQGQCIASGARAACMATVMTRARAAAAFLRRLGVGRDDRVVLLLRNDLAFFEAQFATNMLDAFAVPANWHGTAEECRYIIGDSGAKAVIIHADILRRLGDLAVAVPIIVVATPPEIADAYGIAAAECLVPAPALSWEDIATVADLLLDPSTQLRSAVIYTSGTTGKPKGVVRSAIPEDQVEQTLARTAFGYGLDSGCADKQVLINGPMYHTAPNSYAQTALRLGANIILQPRFDAEEMLALIERYRITHIHLVPIMMHRLLKLPQDVRDRYDLSSLVEIVHGAAPCPPAVKTAMIAWLGPLISEYYGSSETGLLTKLTSQDAAERPGSVGLPLPGVQLKVLNEDGRELPAGEVGDVFAKSSLIDVFRYLGDEGNSAARDGFVTVGDMGRVDEHGYLYLLDRRKDMIISGGVNIYPAEIEAVMLGIEGVRDGVVFGIPDADYGESVIAHVELQPGATLTADEILRKLEEQLARFKIPRQIVFDDHLPREDSGKVFKRKIRDLYWSAAGRSI